MQNSVPDKLSLYTWYKF